MLQQGRLRSFEFWGFVFTVAMSFVMHFVYPWTGSVWAAVIGAANESVWEHTKILFFPYLLFALFEYAVLKPDFRRFVVAKTAGLLVIDLVLISFFFTYSGVLGYHILWVDIGSAIAWAALAHYVSYRLYASSLYLDHLFIAAIITLLMLLTAFFTFTLRPPHINLFYSKGFYGIPR